MSTPAPRFSQLDHYRAIQEAPRWLSPRKCRLFACACCRRTGLLPRAPAARRAVEVAESFADGRAREEEMAEAACALHPEGRATAFAWLAEAVGLACAPSLRLLDAADRASRAERNVRGLDDTITIWSAHLLLLDDLAGHLCHEVTIEPAWLAHDGGAVRNLARGIYAEHAFSDFPVLADALEEAGCADAVILRHLRGGGEHGRGCWILDRLLGMQG